MDLEMPYPYGIGVIKAFNDNLSYDKFITYQLAGDLLPNNYGYAYCHVFQ